MSLTDLVARFEAGELDVSDLPELLGALASAEARVRLAIDSARNQDRGSVGLLTPEMVAEILHVKTHFVYSAARTGELKATRIGSKSGYVRFREEDVNRYIEEHSK